jgi:hypothetical protein
MVGAVLPEYLERLTQVVAVVHQVALEVLV